MGEPSCAVVVAAVETVPLGVAVAAAEPFVAVEPTVAAERVVAAGLIVVAAVAAAEPFFAAEPVVAARLFAVAPVAAAARLFVVVVAGGPVAAAELVVAGDPVSACDGLDLLRHHSRLTVVRMPAPGTAAAPVAVELVVACGLDHHHLPIGQLSLGGAAASDVSFFY